MNRISLAWHAFDARIEHGPRSDEYEAAVEALHVYVLREDAAVAKAVDEVRGVGR